MEKQAEDTQPVPPEIVALERRTGRARTAGDLATLEGALFELGRAYLNSGNVPKGLTQFEEGLEVSAETGNRQAQARFWGYKGIALTQLGNTHFAQIALQKARKLAQEVDDLPLLADCLIHLGQLQAAAGKTSRAIAKYEQALGISRDAGNRPRQMYAAAQAAALFANMGALEKAMEYYSVALDAAERSGRRHAACSYHIAIGNVLLAGGENELAVTRFEEALELASTLEERAAELDALSHLMRAHMATNRLRMATFYADNAIRLARESGAGDVELAQINLLTPYLLEQEQYAQARPYLERGLALAQGQDNWMGQMTMSERLGYVHYQLGEFDQALAAYKEALGFAQHIHEPAARARLLGRLSAVFAEQGAMDEAVTTADKALALARENENDDLIAEQQMLLAFTYQDAGEIDKAITCCREAISTYEQQENEVLREQAEMLLATLVEGSAG